MTKVFKFSLISGLFTKLVNLGYSGLQLNFYKANATRLLTIANFPINNAYTTELFILSILTFFMILFLLYNMAKDDKVDNSKNESNQSLIDEANAL